MSQTDTSSASAGLEIVSQVIVEEGELRLLEKGGEDVPPNTRRCVHCRRKCTPGQTSFLCQFPYIFSVCTAIGYDQQVMALALPRLSTVYQATSSQVQWVLTSFYISNAATSVFNGHMGDVVGPIVYTRALASLAAGLYITSIFMPTLSLIILMRIFSGYAASGIVACKNAITKSLSPQSKLQRYLMWQITTVNVIAVFIPLIGGELVDWLGWESIFVICAFLNVCLVVTSAIIPNPYKSLVRGKMDYGGTIILTISVTCFCLFFSFLAESSFVLMSVFAVLALAFGSGFYAVEKKVAQPLIPFKVLRNPIGAIYAVYISLNIIASGYTATFPFLFSKRYGLSSLSIGIISGSSCVLRIVSSIITPRLDAKIVRRHIIGFTLILTSTVTALSAFFLDIHIAFSITLQMVQTFLLGITGTLLFPMLLTSAPKKYSTLMNGLPTMSRTMGASIGNSLFTAIQTFVLVIDYGQSSPVADDDPNYIRSYVRGCQVSFIVLAFLAAVTGVLSILRIRNTLSEGKKLLYRASQVPQPWEEEDVEERNT